jgi:hypothetical protein
VPITIAIRTTEADGKNQSRVAEDFRPRTFLSIIPDCPPDFNERALPEKVIDVPVEFG